MRSGQQQPWQETRGTVGATLPPDTRGGVLPLGWFEHVSFILRDPLGRQTMTLLLQRSHGTLRKYVRPWVPQRAGAFLGPVGQQTGDPLRAG